MTPSPHPAAEPRGDRGAAPPAPARRPAFRRWTDDDTRRALDRIARDEAARRREEQRP